jgi:hypothetical protein
MLWSAGQHSALRRKSTSRQSAAGTKLKSADHSRASVAVGLAVLTLLLFSKNAYIESFRSFYTFYLINRFKVPVQTSQLMLFLFLAASAVGALVGGILGDRIGRYRIIWISILGPLPLTLLLPYADFFWTGVLTVFINLIMASAFGGTDRVSGRGSQNPLRVRLLTRGGGTPPTCVAFRAKSGRLSTLACRSSRRAADHAVPSDAAVKYFRWAQEGTWPNVDERRWISGFLITSANRY